VRWALVLLLLACTSKPAPAGQDAGGIEEAAPAPTAGPGAQGTCAADADCHATGCSATLCSSQDVITTCEHRPEHDCFRDPTTSCGCFEGRCAWTPTEELKACLGKRP
jgi:eight-cysteine-cluster-containing protein